MGRIVYRQLNAISVAADATQDLWSVIAPSASIVKLHGFELTSADTTAEIIALDLHRITAAGSGGTTGGAEVANEKLGATVATFRLQDTTQGANGGGLMSWQWEQLGPVGIIFTPEMRPESAVSQGFALSWGTASTATISGFVCWEEI